MGIEWKEDEIDRKWAREDLPTLLTTNPEGNCNDALSREYQEKVHKFREATEQLQFLGREILRLGARLSPVRRLSSDILLIIFKILMTDPMVWEDEVKRLCFLQVCSTWREIALKNKSLWTYADISVTFKNEDTQYHNLKFVYYRISSISKYSKGFPVDFSLTILGANLDRFENLLSEALNSKPITFSSFYEKLETNRSWNQFKGCFLLSWANGGFYSESIHHLTQLHLQSDKILKDQRQPTVYSWDNFELPSLQCIQIYELTHLSTIGKFSCPNLRVLTVEVYTSLLPNDGIDEAEAQPLIKYISAFPQLEILHFFSGYEEAEPKPHQGASSSSKLIHLKKIYCGFHGLTEDEIPFPLKSTLTFAPNLVDLDLCTWNFATIEPGSECLKKIQRLHIRSFHCSQVDEEYTNFASLIQVLPELTHLSISASTKGTPINSAKWPFISYKNDEEMEIEEEAPPLFRLYRLFINISRKLQSLALESYSRPEHFPKLAHLHLNDVELNSAALSDFCADWKCGEARLKHCLVSTHSCYYRGDLTQVRGARRSKWTGLYNFKDVHDMPMCKFVELVAEMTSPGQDEVILEDSDASE